METLQRATRGFGVEGPGRNIVGAELVEQGPTARFNERANFPGNNKVSIKDWFRLSAASQMQLPDAYNRVIIPANPGNGRNSARSTRWA
jgi:hypothetical protein